MDLTIPLEKITLNIRVAVLIKKDDGFILEKSRGGYYFPIGGRVKVGETSEEAAKREVFEEIGISVDNLKLRGGVADVNNVNLSEEFDVYMLEQIESLDFRPQVIKEIMKLKTDNILHLTMKEPFGV